MAIYKRELLKEVGEKGVPDFFLSLIRNDIQTYFENSRLVLLIGDKNKDLIDFKILLNDRYNDSAYKYLKGKYEILDSLILKEKEEGFFDNK